jgi:hypothetical protein
MKLRQGGEHPVGEKGALACPPTLDAAVGGR